MATKWIDDRWLKSLDVLTIAFSRLALTFFRSEGVSSSASW
jgi:hypothetical protein